MPNDKQLSTNTKALCVGVRFGGSFIIFAGLTLNEFLFGVRWVEGAFVIHFGIFELGASW